jgi:hypothetical protein
MAPAYFHPNTAPLVQPPNAALDVLEALQLASLNVFSVATLLVVGGAFAMDVSTLEKLRPSFRASNAMQNGKGKEDCGEEFEEWMVSVLARN